MQRFSVIQRDPSTRLGMTGNQLPAIFFCLYFAIASSVFAQPDAEFAKANQEYAQGNFKEAIASYEALVRADQWNANLFYDLGNAYFRTREDRKSVV